MCHTSIQHNHLHFLIEADDKKAFSHGMRSLAITAALAINDVCGRSGKVFAYRYHATSIGVPPGYEPLPSAEATTWLLRVGWERHGLISAYAVPGGAP